ncbi:hypothetical protein [Rhodococcus jostii]|uniref:hypothetical protein n=1 Tax=Rhodococcus jostii TaxID=132919 RepID=UPI00364C7AAD
MPLTRVHQFIPGSADAGGVSWALVDAVTASGVVVGAAVPIPVPAQTAPARTLTASGV